MTTTVPESVEVQQHAKRRVRQQHMQLLEKRIRRALQHGRLHLHKSRGERNTWLFGTYWVCDSMGVMPILRHVELPALARRLHVYFSDLDIE